MLNLNALRGCGAGEYGYGYGGSYGNGYGCGYGCSYDDDSGFGDGDTGGGSEVVVAKVGDYDVELIAPFDVVRIGCQARTIGEWRRDWRTVAAREKSSVDESRVAELFAKAEVILQEHQHA